MEVIAKNLLDLKTLDVLHLRRDNQACWDQGFFTNTKARHSFFARCLLQLDLIVQNNGGSNGAIKNWLHVVGLAFCFDVKMIPQTHITPLEHAETKRPSRGEFCMQLRAGRKLETIRRLLDSQERKTGSVRQSCSAGKGGQYRTFLF